MFLLHNRRKLFLFNILLWNSLYPGRQCIFILSSGNNPANEFDIELAAPHVGSSYNQDNIRAVVIEFQNVLHANANKLTGRDQIHLFILLVTKEISDRVILTHEDRKVTKKVRKEWKNKLQDKIKTFIKKEQD